LPAVTNSTTVRISARTATLLTAWAGGAGPATSTVALAVACSAGTNVRMPIVSKGDSRYVRVSGVLPRAPPEAGVPAHVAGSTATRRAGTGRRPQASAPLQVRGSGGWPWRHRQAFLVLARTRLLQQTLATSSEAGCLVLDLWSLHAILAELRIPPILTCYADDHRAEVASTEVSEAPVDLLRRRLRTVWPVRRRGT
jgi:hypothetical protein